MQKTIFPRANNKNTNGRVIVIGSAIYSLAAKAFFIILDSMHIAFFSPLRAASC